MYDVIGDWLLCMDSTMQFTGQSRFTRSFSGSYKMMNGSRVCKLERVRCRFHGCEVESSESTEACSWWARQGWQMIQPIQWSSAMSDVFIVSSTLLIGYLQKWSPLVICKVILIRTTFACLCPLVEYFVSPTPNFCLIRAVCFQSRV